MHHTEQSGPQSHNKLLLIACQMSCPQHEKLGTINKLNWQLAVCAQFSGKLINLQVFLLQGKPEIVQDYSMFAQIKIWKLLYEDLYTWSIKLLCDYLIIQYKGIQEHMECAILQYPNVTACQHKVMLILLAMQ